MIDPVSTPAPGLVRRLLLRVLLVLVLVAVAIGVRFILTGHISEGGAKMLLTGLGTGLFGACGLGADAAGRRLPSLWSRLGPLAAIAGAALVVVGIWTGAWSQPWWWRAVGVCFVVAFAGLRGALMRAVVVDGLGAALRAIALFGVQLSMGLGVMSCLRDLSPAGWKLFGIAVLVEAGAAVAMLAARAVAPPSPPPPSAADGQSGPGEP
jgi:hypothetical protein